MNSESHKPVAKSTPDPLRADAETHQIELEVQTLRPACGCHFDAAESQVGVAFCDIFERRAAEIALLLDREQQRILRELLEETVKGCALVETLESCLARLLAVSWPVCWRFPG